MTLRNCSSLALVALAVLIACPEGRAQDATGYYFGINGGRAKNGFHTSDYEAALEKLASNGSQTLTFKSRTIEDKSNAWWAEAGYMRWSHVGLEVDFLHLGELAYRGYATLAPPTSPLVATTNVSTRGPALALLIRVPLVEQVALNVRVGDYYGRTETIKGYSLQGSYAPTAVSTTVSSLLLGAGAAYAFDGHWSAHIDYLRVQKAGDSRTGTFNLDVATLGASYNF